MDQGAFANITTPRLRLVPVTEADPRDVAEGIGNYDVSRWLGRVPYPYSVNDAVAFINANRDQQGRVWFIMDVLGLCGGISIDDELGYWIARRAWGQGYASEAGEAVIDAHFARPESADLVAGHFPGNERSAAVLRRLGFAYTGLKKVRSESLGQVVDSQQMSLSRDTWTERRQIDIMTDRLRLRLMRDSDWRRVQQIGGDPSVARMMMAMTTPWPEDDVRRWIAVARFRGLPGYRLAVETPDGALIGVVGLGPDRSVSFMLDRRYWNRGLMTEALQAFLQDIFDRFAWVDALVADHFADNPASAAVLRKLGFEQTGTGLGSSKARVERAPNVLYRLPRNRFGSSQ